MKLFRLSCLSLLLLCFTTSLAPLEALEGSNFRVRVGLYQMGFPREFVIQPSNNCLEIYDPNAHAALSSGRCSAVRVVAAPPGIVVYDGPKLVARSTKTLLFSAVGRPPSHFEISAGKVKKAFRGSLAIVPWRGRLFVVNVVDLEDYLKSVIPPEMGDQAPAASFEAQAIAARTYALCNLNRHDPSGFDLCDRVHCQVYSGMQREVAAATLAAQKTLGQVLLYDGKFANTVYHANCGGKLSSCQSVWGGKSVPYLIAHDDSLGNHGFFCNLTQEEIRNGVVALQAKPRTTPVAVSSKRRFLRASRGHRVGMCQDGAIGMGLAGYPSRQILGFYYPGTQLALMRYAKKQPAPPPPPPQIALAKPAFPPTLPPGGGGPSIRETLSEIAAKNPGKPKVAGSSLQKWYWSALPPRKFPREAWTAPRPGKAPDRAARPATAPTQAG